MIFQFFPYPIPVFLKCVLLSCDIKLFHEKSPCYYSLYSDLCPHANSKEIFIGSDTYFAIRFPESTTQLVAVNRRLRPVSCVSWLPFDMGKLLKEKKNQTNKPTEQKLQKQNHPPQGHERWQGVVCISMCRFHCWLGIPRHGRRDKYYSSAFLHRPGTAWNPL